MVYAEDMKELEITDKTINRGEVLRKTLKDPNKLFREHRS